MKVLSFIVAAALLGLTGASSNSSQGLLKSDGGKYWTLTCMLSLSRSANVVYSGPG